MAKKTKDTPLPIDADLLEHLRDPQAVQERERYGADPGRLELVRDAWLVSSDTGYKYPIRDGIPVMLVDEGAKWKDTPVTDLPVPPPAAEPPAERGPEIVTPEPAAAASHIGLYVAIAALVVVLLVLVGLARRRPAAPPPG